MLRISFSSVFMTVLTGTMMLLIIVACFRIEKLIAGIGHRLMTVFCVLVAVRLLLPLELPFARTLAFPPIVSDVITFFLHPYGSIGWIWLSLWTVLCLAWLIGAIVAWYKFGIIHGWLRYYLEENGKNVTAQEPYATMLKTLCSKRQLSKIVIRKVKGISSPMILGLFKPLILLPENVDVTVDDTYFAIKHEICHYAHHDLWIITLVKWLTIAYWWNPCFRPLNKRINLLMEIRIDETIMQKSPEEALRYLLSLYHHLGGTDKRFSKKDDDNPPDTLALNKKDSLGQRIQMMRHQGEKKKIWMCVGMTILMVSIYIGSYMIVVEPSSYLFDIKEEQFTTVGNVYAIGNEEEGYNVYMNSGLFLEWTDTLEYYPLNITIYSSEEEYHEKNQ